MQVPLRELVARLVSLERHGRSGSSSCSSGHSPLRMRLFQAHGASVSARTCKLTSRVLPALSQITEILAARVLTAQLTLLAPSFNWRSLSVPSTAPLTPIPHLARRYIRTTLALIAVVALIGPLSKSAKPAPTPVPAHSRARIVNAGIWAVHFGIDNAGRDSQRSMRDLFRDMDLDLVGLLETDLHVSLGSLWL